jgi:hypothetical protein
MCQFMIGKESLYMANVDGVIQLTSSTSILTRMGTNATADTRQDVFFPDQLKGLLVSASVGQGNVTLRIHPKGAVVLAKGPFPLFNTDVSGEAHPSAELNGFFAIRGCDGAGFEASATQCAEILIDIRLIFSDACAETLGRVLKRHKLSGGETRDQRVS